MKKYSLFAIGVAAALAGCSSDDVINESAVRKSAETPIGFNVEKQNITRSANLETVKHYNFGVWAWKVQGKNSLEDQEVMNNYLVGYSGTNVGYDHTNATTWASVPGEVTDHTSPWFYEGLGTSEYNYSGDAGFYKSSDADYMSNNTNQYLRYWDLAYENTNFYCYAPYNANVTFTHTQNGTSTMTFPSDNSIRDGYDLPLNSTYNAYSRTLGEFMYAGVNATNSSLSDVTVPFKHLGAQLFIRFYEEIPGYKVEIIELAEDRGTAVGNLAENMKGIQAAPAVNASGTYSKGYYFTHSGATVTFTEKNGDTPWSVGTPAFNWNNDKKVQTPLAFKIPQTGTDYETYSVAPGNLTPFAAPKGNTTSHNVIPEKVASGAQEYSYSPTIYYPVAQPKSGDTQYQNSGLTFHVSYRIIAEDNGEVTTVHNATVHVPVTGTIQSSTYDHNSTEASSNDTDDHKSGSDYYITAWQPNVKYTYTFLITKNSNGTTNPDGEIDPTDPDVDPHVALYPIVFDAATIEDYTTNYSEYTISEGTGYNQTTP